MAQNQLPDKIRRAAEVICRQGLIQFPVTATAVAIIEKVVGEAPDELDLVYAFREKPSQTLEQLVASSGMAQAEIERLAVSRRRLLPSECITKTSSLPLRLEVKAICAPSGDQHGR